MTPMQLKLLKFITAYIKRTGGVPPTYAEMAEHMGLKSKAGIHRIVSGLKHRGYIDSKPGCARSIVLVTKADGCCATCGRPMP